MKTQRLIFLLSVVLIVGSASLGFGQTFKKGDTYLSLNAGATWLNDK